jgi:crotonobetaine/carnitine-CoA ligase
MREPQASVPVLLKQRAETDPSGVLIQEITGRSITNAAFHEMAQRIADALRTLAVAPGDCVVTVNDTCIEAYASWIGISWLGAMEVPVNPEFRGQSLIYGISDCKAKVLITANSHLNRLLSVIDQLPYIETLITTDDRIPEDIEPEATVLVQTLASISRNAPCGDYTAPQLTDPYAVIYTSGTTGPSKGVVVPWGGLQYAAVDRMFAGDDPESYQDPAFYSPWPIFHASSRTGLAFVAERGGRLVIRARLSASAFWDDIRRFACTHAHLIGVAGFLYVQPERPNDAENPLRRILMNPVLAEYRAFEQRFGVVVSTGWGMTEIGFPMATADLPNAKTCGALSPLYEARIVDDAGLDLADGQVGQLIVRAKRPWLLLKEYLGKPEATSQAWRDGWFYTGDALRRDANGHYYFVDRVADYMRVRGNNVSSVEVENEVRSHPDVADVAAIGVPASLGAVAAAAATVRAAASEDEIKLVVLRHPGSRLTESGLLHYLIPRLPRFMTPRFIEFVDELPRTSTGKIQKRSLRAALVSAKTWDRLAHDIDIPR